MKQGLAAIADAYPDVIESIRGVGLMLGIKCVAPNTKLAAAMREEKLLAVTAGDNVVRLLPPLVVTDEDIRLALDGIRAAARRVSAAAH